MFYDLLFGALARRGVRYVIVGGLAVNLHGVPRKTFDVDLVVDLSEENLRHFIDAVRELGFRPRLPVPLESFLEAAARTEWVEKRNLKAFTLWNPEEGLPELDILLAESQQKALFDRASVIPFGNIEVSVASIDDLIEMKQRANRDRDLADIESLRQVREILEETNGQYERSLQQRRNSPLDGSSN